MTNFWIKVKKTESCWIWEACTDGKGYGVFHIPGTKNKVKKAYRFSYEMVKGPVPEKHDIDHLCKNKLCVNPEHLEMVPHKENVMRGNSFMAARAMQTHCIRGHEFTKQNTGSHHGRRTCKACNRTPEAREKNRLRMKKHREKTQGSSPRTT